MLLLVDIKKRLHWFFSVFDSITHPSSFDCLLFCFFNFYKKDFTCLTLCRACFHPLGALPLPRKA